MRNIKAVCLALVIGLPSCGQSTNITPSVGICSLQDLGWRELTFDPPNRVLVLTIGVSNDRLSLNNKAASRENILRSLDSSKSLRPSPYAVIEVDSRADCANLVTLSREIDRAFNCRTNHCFFRRL